MKYGKKRTGRQTPKRKKETKKEKGKEVTAKDLNLIAQRLLESTVLQTQVLNDLSEFSKILFNTVQLFQKRIESIERLLGLAENDDHLVN